MAHTEPKDELPDLYFLKSQFNLETMDNGLPSMDSKDVEDIFNDVMASDESQGALFQLDAASSSPTVPMTVSSSPTVTTAPISTVRVSSSPVLSHNVPLGIAFKFCILCLEIVNEYNIIHFPCVCVSCVP